MKRNEKNYWPNGTLHVRQKNLYSRCSTNPTNIKNVENVGFEPAKTNFEIWNSCHAVIAIENVPDSTQ
jgi:hypothetical protein